MTAHTVVGVEVLRGLQAHLEVSAQAASSAERYAEALQYLQCARLCGTYGRSLDTHGSLGPVLLWMLSRDVETYADRAHRYGWAEADGLDTIYSGLCELAEVLERTDRV